MELVDAPIITLLINLEDATSCSCVLHFITFIGATQYAGSLMGVRFKPRTLRLYVIHTSTTAIIARQGCMYSDISSQRGQPGDRGHSKNGETCDLFRK
jgi:hypothetical protein